MASSSVNRATILGNVGKDPEIRSTQDGKTIVNLVIATSEYWKNKNGEKQERTEWHKIVIFNEALAKIVEQYVKKGTKLYVEGSIHTRKWTDNTGNDRYTTEIVLQGYNCTLTILDSKSGSSGGNDYFEQKSSQKEDFVDDQLDDEIPF